MPKALKWARNDVDLIYRSFTKHPDYQHNSKIIKNTSDSIKVLTLLCGNPEVKNLYDGDRATIAIGAMYKRKKITIYKYADGSLSSFNCWGDSDRPEDGYFWGYMNDGKTKYLSEVIITHLKTIA